MSCENPLTAYRPTNGGPVTFRRPQSRTYQELTLPCGQCILCRLEQTRQWAVRITHEAQFHKESCFLTLTLDDKYINQYGGLDYKKHMQPFWKRLRKEIGALKYFAVGEYGEKSMRPHYHACLFGHAFTENRYWIRRGDRPLWSNPTIDRIWGQGLVSVGVLNYQTASYTAGYICKKLTGNDGYVHLDDTTGEITWLEQPRAYMSLKPAIGHNWIAKYGKDVYAHDHVIINGVEQKPPKYYDQWLKKKSEIAEEMIKKERIKKAPTLTQEQNHARARNARARVKAKSKSV